MEINFRSNAGGTEAQAKRRKAKAKDPRKLYETILKSMRAVGEGLSNADAEIAHQQMEKLGYAREDYMERAGLAGLTEEERKAKVNAREAKRMRERRARMTPEERRAMDARDWQQVKERNKDPAKAEAYYKRRRAAAKRRRDAWTPEQKKAEKARRRERHHRWFSALTPEEKEAYNADRRRRYHANKERQA